MIEKKHRPFTKAEIIESLTRLPDDATVEDAMEWLYVMAKIELGSQQLRDGRGIPHEEIVREMAEWQDESGRHSRDRICARSDNSSVGTHQSMPSS